MKLGEMLNKSAIYGEPAPQCDAGINQIKVLAPLILPQKFLHLFNQRFFSTTVRILHEDVITPRKVNEAMFDQWLEASGLTSRQGTCLIDIRMKRIGMTDFASLSTFNR